MFLNLNAYDVESLLVAGTYLKRGSSYDVVKCYHNTLPLVLKLAGNTEGRTQRLIFEFERLSLLATVLPKLKKVLIEPISAGFYKDRFYYILPYVSGQSLSEHLWSETCTHKTQKLIDMAVSLAWDLQNERNLLPTARANVYSFAKQFIMEELNASLSLFPERLIHESNLQIQGLSCKNLAQCITQLFEMKSVVALRNSFYLKQYGHWNLHGGNILFDDICNIFIIDPDTKIYQQDSLFELARLNYTSDHDIMESDCFEIGISNFKTFEITYSLSEPQILNFNALREKFVKSSPVFHSDNGKHQFIYTRFAIAYLTCLIRGIHANYSQNENDNFENLKTSKSFFLFLRAVQFANEFMEEECL